MAIDVGKLTKEQKQTYDFWRLTRGEETEELETLLNSLVKPKGRPVKKEVHEDNEKPQREAEAVLLHLRRNNTLMQKECLECHRPFATNYAYAGRCSDDCIRASLHAVGIEWDESKTPQERWNGPGVNGEIPAIISPETLVFLKQWARTILSWDEPKEFQQPQKLPDSWAADAFAGMPAQPHIVNGHQNGWEISTAFKYPRIQIPEGHLEEIKISAVEAEQRLMEEDLRNEYTMSGDVYGGTDLLNIDWDSL